MRNLTLLVPGLLGPGGETAQDQSLPRLPALEMLLTRGRREVLPEADREASLCGLFGVRADARADLPVAALTALADCGQSAPAWLRADPVHLRPDMAKLILFDASSFALSREEASGLVEVLQPAMTEHGFELISGRSAERWYLALPAPARIRTHSLGEAVGRHVAPLLPAGEQADFWRRLANECQMLLHDTAVNLEREARGEPAVNSLWFWGAGALDAPPPPRWTRVWSDEPLAHGLARHTGVPSEPCAEGAGAWYGQLRDDGNLLIVLCDAERPAQYPDFGLWRDAVAGLEKRWIAPLTGLLRQRRLQRLTVQCEGQSWSVRPRDLMRFWLRPHAIRSQD